eukprot:scaffold266783_cov35-Tisochrysis_lutea.AAC.4
MNFTHPAQGRSACQRSKPRAHHTEAMMSGPLALCSTEYECKRRRPSAFRQRSPATVNRAAQLQ